MYLIRLLSCVNSLMNQSFAVAIKSFGTIAADKSVCVEVNYFFMPLEGRLVFQDFATLGAWNLLIILLQHLVVGEVTHLPRVHPHVVGKLLPLSEIGATLLTLKKVRFFNLYIGCCTP